jgi:hypothetical protein
MSAYLDAITTVALLGTSRQRSPMPAAPQDLQPLLGQLSSCSPEATVLLSAAVAGLHDRAGRRPVRLTRGELKICSDPRPICSQSAADLYKQLSGTNDPLLELQWLTTCAAKGLRPPAHLLPLILDRATTLRSSREQSVAADIADAATIAVGPFAQLLVPLSPQWAWMTASAAPVDPKLLWETGSKPERIDAMKRMRLQDPAAARQLLAESIAEESAADRAELVTLLSHGLSAGDEPFLESALDDKSQQVRLAAAMLLARLPGSALTQRMIARATPLLTFNAATKGGFLKRGQRASLSMELPAAFDASMKRDAITEAPPTGIGPRQHWLSSILAMITPSHWSGLFGSTPEQLLSALPEDHAPLVTDAWQRAAVMHQDALWSSALIRQAASSEMAQPPTDLFAALPESDRRSLLIELLESRVLDNRIWAGMLATCMTWDTALGQSVIEHLKRYKPESKHQHYPLQTIVHVMPPDGLSELEQVIDTLLQEAFDNEKRVIRNVLNLRRQIHQEFHS